MLTIQNGQISATGKWRTVFEMSCMSNNDEVVVYTDGEAVPPAWDEDTQSFAEWEDEKTRHASLLLGMSPGPFSLPRLVMSRPLYAFEEVDTSYKGSTHDEKVGEMTHLVDGITRFTNFVNTMSLSTRRDPKEAVEYWISHNFYDCMSGGASGIGLAMAEALIKQYWSKEELSNDVYPSSRKEGWHTVSDFLSEMEKADLPRDKVPPLTLMLPEPTLV